MLATFLFSDIEGSTELLRRLGPEYTGIVSRYEALVRDACECHGGSVVDTQGDSVFGAFPRGGGLDAAAPNPTTRCQRIVENRGHVTRLRADFVTTSESVRVYSAAAHGRPEAETDEIAARQAPGPARDRGPARQRVPDVPPAEAPASRLPDLRNVQGP